MPIKIRRRWYYPALVIVMRSRGEFPDCYLINQILGIQPFYRFQYLGVLGVNFE
jgi:hypothetical protein